MIEKYKKKESPGTRTCLYCGEEYGTVACPNGCIQHIPVRNTDRRLYGSSAESSIWDKIWYWFAVGFLVGMLLFLLAVVTAMVVNHAETVAVFVVGTVVLGAAAIVVGFVVDNAWNAVQWLRS